MRYVSLLIFAVLMALSWKMIEAPAAVPEATHILIQEDLKRIISEKIAEDLPSAQAIQFDRFWTQNLKGDKVKASFLVSFDLPDAAEPARHGIQGQYILTFDEKTGQWSGDGDFEYTQISFKNGVVITPSGSAADEAETAEEAKEATAKPAPPAPEPRLPKPTHAAGPQPPHPATNPPPPKPAPPTTPTPPTPPAEAPAH